MARFGAVLQDDGVAVANVTANHGIAHNAKREGVARRFKSNGIDVHRDAALGFLLPVFPKAGGDGAEERNIHDAAAELGDWGYDA
jgi:hypothetical protein